MTTTTSIGKYRHLSRVANREGHFVVLAIDHRGNLLAELNKHAPAPLDDTAFAAFKGEVIAHLSPLATGVLVDPAYGITQAIANRSIDGRLGLLAPVEVTDYSLHASLRPIEFIPGWSVDKIKRVGGDGVKLLLPFHPESPMAEEKRAQVRDLVAACARCDIPFFLEPIPHTLSPDQPLTNDELRSINVAMAREFSVIGVDVLKLPFPIDVKHEPDEPVWRAACDEVHAACTVPWVLLSAGVDFATFARQARIACEAGASGVIVGRAVWAEAVTLQGEARTRFLTTTAVERMRELAAICHDAGQPWTARINPPITALDWYESYTDFNGK